MLVKKVKNRTIKVSLYKAIYYANVSIQNLLDIRQKKHTK
jgi:hypothetical protein